MSADRFHFRGPFLMRFLADELERITSDLSEMSQENLDLEFLDGADLIYEKYAMRPLVLREMGMKVNITQGYRDGNIFLARHDIRAGDPGAVRCAVIEYHIPFEGDERLFDHTTSPMPFYPYGRVENGCFIISVRDGEMSYLSDYQHQLSLLRECIRLTSLCVDCFNEYLRDSISRFGVRSVS